MRPNHGDYDYIFYDSDIKGTLIGKLIFSVLFALSTLFPIIIGYQTIDVWVKAVLITFFIVSVFELVQTIKYINLFEAVYDEINHFSIFSVYLIVLFFGLIIFPIYLIKDLNIIFTIIAITIVTDTLMNIFGKMLAKLPEDYQLLRLRYPTSISKNKSFMAIILSLGVIIEFVAYFDTKYVLLTTFVVFATAIGDIFFSIYKRLIGVDDFFPTLGPIGGLLDRIDGWIFAFMFGGYYYIFYMKVM
jgi:CDP-diglyceride synthetase